MNALTQKFRSHDLILPWWDQEKSQKAVAALELGKNSLVLSVKCQRDRFDHEVRNLAVKPP